VLAQSNTETFEKSRANSSGIPTRERRDNSWNKILRLLRERKQQGRGAKNWELAQIAIRYNARINESKAQGYDYKITRESAGVWDYALVSEPEHLKPLPTYEPRKADPRQGRLSNSPDWYERQTGHERPGKLTDADAGPLFAGGRT